MLANLLNRLPGLETEGLFRKSVVVVDNDSMKSAEPVVFDFMKRNELDVKYLVEKEQNISLARNMAISNAPGNYVALIDDDEFPEKDWLLNLYKSIRQFNADGVLGPVKPFFSTKPPEWILKGKICERPTYPTGRIIKREFRTGNVLLGKKIFMDGDNYFDPKYGRLGGEDVDFFDRITRKGFVSIWCAEAPVYEYVPEERFKGSYYLRRYMRIGGVSGKRLRESAFDRDTFVYFAKIGCGLILYALTLPIVLFMGKHYLMKYAIKVAHNIGFIFGFAGVELINEKN